MIQTDEIVPRSSYIVLGANGIKIEVDLDIGHIASFTVRIGDQITAPFHRVSWADDTSSSNDFDFGTAPHLERMSGDFFCAPFAASDIEAAPPHGWPANGRWSVFGNKAFKGGHRLTCILERTVLGATIYKELTVRDGHPFLYQRHTLKGGNGKIPVANHAMVFLPSTGLITTSPKSYAETPAAPLEADPRRGNSILKYPATLSDLTTFPKNDDNFANLMEYPLTNGHEDFVMLVEKAGAQLGWTTVDRPDQQDLALFLKNPSQLPITMLWYSNGGRFYPPWNSRHRGVLGVEDGCTYSLNGHAASILENPLSASGVPTAIELVPNGSVEVRNIIGAVPVPLGWGRVKDIVTENGFLSITSATGPVLNLSFDTDFLKS